MFSNSTSNNISNNGIISTSSGNLDISPNSAIVKVYTSGTNSKITIYDSGGTKYIYLSHDGTNGYLACTSGSLILQSPNGTVNVNTAGQNNQINLTGSGGTNYIKIQNDNTDGVISTNSGDLKLNPNADINANAKTIKGIGALTYNSAQSLTRHIPASAFVPEDDTYSWIITYSSVISRDTGALICHAPVILPTGAVITSFKVNWYRDDAAASGECDLVMSTDTGGSSIIATADSDSSSGAHSVTDSSIGTHTVDNSTNAFNIVFTLTPNDDKNDVKFYSVVIGYTLDNPLS